MNYILANNNILTPLGLKSIEELTIQDNVYSLDSNNIFNITPIMEIHKDVSFNEFLQIKSQSGNFYIPKEGICYKLHLHNFNNKYGYDKSIIAVKAQELCRDDYVIQPTNLTGLNCNIEIIDLLPIIQDLLKLYVPTPKLFMENNFIWICRSSSQHLKIPRFINAQALCNILAWYIAEGCSKKDCYTRHNKDGSKYRSEFSQSLKANLPKVEKIKQDLNDAQFNAKFQFSKQLYNGIPRDVTIFMSNIMAVLMQSCGCCSTEKQIPLWLKQVLYKSQILREQFLYTICLADGFATNSRYPGFCTCSQKLLYDMITLIQLSGYHFTLQNTKNRTKYITYSKLGTKNALISLGHAKFCKIIDIVSVKYNIPSYKIKLKDYHNLLVGDYGQILIQI